MNWAIGLLLIAIGVFLGALYERRLRKSINRNVSTLWFYVSIAFNLVLSVPLFYLGFTYTEPGTKFTTLGLAVAVVSLSISYLVTFESARQSKRIENKIDPIISRIGGSYDTDQK